MTQPSPHLNNTAIDVAPGPSAFQPRSGSFHHFTRVFIASRAAKEPTSRVEVADDAPVWPWHELGQAVTLPKYQTYSDEEYFDVDQLAGAVHAIPVRWNHHIAIDTLDAHRNMLRAALDCSLVVISRIDGHNDWVYVPRALMMDPPHEASTIPWNNGYLPLSQERTMVEVKWQVVGPEQATMHRDMNTNW